MTASTSLRKGQVVRYEGSQASERGLLFRVAARWSCDGECVRMGYSACDVCPRGGVLYDLSYYIPGTPFSELDEVILSGARPKSVTHTHRRPAGPNPHQEESMSVTVEVHGQPVTPMSAARTLNEAGGPFPVLVAAEREGGPEVVIYARHRDDSGSERPPELRAPAFTATTVEEIREYEHVLSIAADIVLLAGALAAQSASAA